MKKNIVYRGFTLIELLIVVAIIAILAAIAIPNFLAAQVRAKVTKSKSEMRNVATALESYHVDNNQYPLPYSVGYWNVPDSLSTPIAYVSNIKSFYDPFSTKHPGTSVLHRYGYVTSDWPYHTETQSRWDLLTQDNKERAGKWRLDGYGPTVNSGGGWPNVPSYDPTNGTVSNGQIYRSEKDPQGIQI
ncbi:MAG: prepilin-type N-terminal cleavage/methylation domain-containing protein [bacterium]